MSIFRALGSREFALCHAKRYRARQGNMATNFSARCSAVAARLPSRSSLPIVSRNGRPFTARGSDLWRAPFAGAASHSGTISRARARFCPGSPDDLCVAAQALICSCATSPCLTSFPFSAAFSSALARCRSVRFFPTTTPALFSAVAFLINRRPRASRSLLLAYAALFVAASNLFSSAFLFARVFFLAPSCH
jgi:hypothetical protein